MRAPDELICKLAIAKGGDRVESIMKIVVRNVRSPRKYSELRSLSLCDDRGIIWVRVDFSERGTISIRHLEGVKVNTHQVGGLGDWDLDNEFRRSWRSRQECPKCQEKDEVLDERTHQVKCKACGEVY